MRREQGYLEPRSPDESADPGPPTRAVGFIDPLRLHRVIAASLPIPGLPGPEALRAAVRRLWPEEDA